MSTARERSQGRRRVFRLEALEDRNLLSAAAVGPVAAEVQSRPVTGFTGHVQGERATAGLYVKTFPGFTSYSGHGSATPPIRNVLFSSQDYEVPFGTTVGIGYGNAQFITYKGERIDATYSGTGQAARGRATVVRLYGTVTGGTGEFVGAAGSFTATGSINPATGRFVLNYAVSIAHTANT